MVNDTPPMPPLAGTKNRMVGKLKAFLNGFFMGGLTIAALLFFVNGTIFTSHYQTRPTLSKSYIRSSGKTNGNLASGSQRPRPRMILATTNSGFLDFTRNWLASLRRSDINDHVVIVAEDADSFQTLSNYTGHPHLHVKMATDAKRHTEGVLKFSSNEYLQFVNKRPAYILHFLNKGFDVLFSDVDVVLLKDPFPYFDNSVDVNFQMDIWKRDNHNHSDVFCAGFAFYLATEATCSFLKRLMLRISLEPQVPDQVLLNRLLREKDMRNALRTHALDGDLFVSGRYYFNETWRALHNRRHPVMVHNNWIKRSSDKLKRFQEQGLWNL